MDTYRLVHDPKNAQRKAASKRTTLYYRYRGLIVFQLRVPLVGYLSRWMMGPLGAPTWKQLKVKIDEWLDGSEN